MYEEEELPNDKIPTVLVPDWCEWFAYSKTGVLTGYAEMPVWDDLDGWCVSKDCLFDYLWGWAGYVQGDYKTSRDSLNRIFRPHDLN